VTELAAVLFDMDGTVVDTEPYWIQAEAELVQQHGGTWRHEDALGIIGFGLWESAKVLQRHGVDLEADEIVATLTSRVQEMIDERGLPWRPGAQELLRELKDHGVRTALVTMSIRRMAEQIVATIPFPAFDLLVTGDEVDEPKPHPDPYLTAVRLLGVEAGHCVAIEDSINGLASAVAAGTIAVGVPHMIAIPEGEGHVIWPSLQGRGYADVLALFEERAA
jgi:HAD superfamily hydrolase (TIGR01509 family)